MNFEACRALIETHLQTVTLTGLTVEWEGGKQKAKNGGPWAKWHVLFGKTEPATIGAGHLRGFGFVSLQVFLPEATGTRVATQAGDALATALNNLQLREGMLVITFKTVEILNAGTSKGITQKNLVCNFQTDDYR